MAVYVAHTDKNGNETQRRYLPIYSYGRVRYPVRTYIRRLEYKGIENSWSSGSDRERNFNGLPVDRSLSSLECCKNKDSRKHKGQTLTAKISVGSVSSRTCNCFDATFSSDTSMQSKSAKHRKNCSCNCASSFGSAKSSKSPYEAWLSEKKKQNAKKLAKRKEAEKRLREETENRKKLAEQKYEEWLASKANQESRKYAQQKQKQQQQQLQRQQKQKKPMVNSKSKVVSPEVVENNLILWEKIKIAEKQEKRQKERLERQRRMEEDQRRKEASEQAWREWHATAGNKPKPVPLNCGLLSLRGTVSDIYVNPNEWKSIIDEDDKGTKPTGIIIDKANKHERHSSK